MTLGDRVAYLSAEGSAVLGVVAVAAQLTTPELALGVTVAGGAAAVIFRLGELSKQLGASHRTTVTSLKRLDRRIARLEKRAGIDPIYEEQDLEQDS